MLGGLGWGGVGCNNVPCPSLPLTCSPGRVGVGWDAITFLALHPRLGQHGGMGVGWMSPSATPATQSSAAPQRDQASHQTQPSPRSTHLPLKTKVDVISTTPATQNESGCHQVPRLPRETTADVTKCHACPRETTADVTKCHACHAK